VGDQVRTYQTGQADEDQEEQSMDGTRGLPTCAATAEGDSRVADPRIGERVENVREQVDEDETD
jgi:hypothetical protein